MHEGRRMRKIQTFTFFERIFAWGRQNHPDPHCRCHSHPQTPVCLCIFPTLLVPRARKVACETADKQTTCSCRCGAACVRKKSVRSSWAMDRTAPNTVQGEKLVCAKLLCCESDVLIASARGVTDCQVESLFIWFRAPWKLRGFALPVDTRHIAGCMPQTIIASHRSTARGRGQVRRSLQSHTFLQATKFERKANRDEVFIVTRGSRRLHYNFPLFYLQAASKTQAFDAGDTLLRPSSGWVDFINPLSTPLRRKSTRTQAQHTLGTNTGRRSWHDVGFTCFPKPHALSSIPANRAQSSADLAHSWSATWQLVVLVPESTATHVAKHMAILRNDSKKHLHEKQSYLSYRLETLSTCHHLDKLPHVVPQGHSHHCIKKFGRSGYRCRCCGQCQACHCGVLGAWHIL